MKNAAAAAAAIGKQVKVVNSKCKTEKMVVVGGRGVEGHVSYWE